MWWYPHVIPTLEKLRQEEPGIQASLGYKQNPLLQAKG